MKLLFLILIPLALASCKTNFSNSQTLENLEDKDTLLIEACIHHHCGGEWGGCLEWTKIYKQGNSYSVKFTNGITVWNADTIIDPKKTKSITKTLTNSDMKIVNDFLHQVTIFSDSLSITSNGPNYYVVKAKGYKKIIIRDYDQWLFYQKLTDNLYK